MSVVRSTALPSLRERTTVAVDPSSNLSGTFLASSAASTRSAGVWVAAGGASLVSAHGWKTAPTPTAASTAAAAARLAIRNRRRLRIGTTLEVVSLDDRRRRSLGRQRADVGDAGQDGGAQAGWRGDGSVVGHQGGRLTEAGDLVLAVVAAGEVLLEGRALVVVECVDDVGTGQRVHRLMR